MRLTLRTCTQFALTSVLGIALYTSVGLKPVQAQDMMGDHDGMMMDHEMGIPVTPSYPRAAPGSLDLNHWTDYSRVHMKPGSATGAKSDMMRERDRMKMMSTMDEADEDMRIPATPSYPRATPGSLDLNHWTDYSRMHMKPGSATGAKSDMMRERDRMKMMSTMDEADEMYLLPTSPSYPFAAPGTLDLNHWTDLTKKHMMAGSATEARMEKRKKMHEKMHTP